MNYEGFRFERDPDRHRILVTLAAKATVDVCWASMFALGADAVWRVPIVYNMSAVDSGPLLRNLSSLVGAFLRLRREKGERGPVAVVVRADDLDVWRNRLAVFFRDSLTIDAFSTTEAATRWLDDVARQRDRT